MYVLTVIHPPEGGAAYGKAEVRAPITNVVDTSHAAFRVMVGRARPGMAWGQADQYRAILVSAAIRDGHGEVTVPSGFTFRIDPADNPPHPCPCDGCGRLVLPTDHAYADAEDAYCLGCFTWNRGDVQCLPESTAHPAEES